VSTQKSQRRSRSSKASLHEDAVGGYEEEDVPEEKDKQIAEADAWAVTTDHSGSLKHGKSLMSPRYSMFPQIGQR